MMLKEGEWFGDDVTEFFISQKLNKVKLLCIFAMVVKRIEICFKKSFKFLLKNLVPRSNRSTKQ